MKIMPSYKLCYFNFRGLGEMSRLIFAEAGVEFEDCRIEPTDWPNNKSNMKFGKMPVLYVDGEEIAHSRAIVRYLARKFNLEGGSELNAAKMDAWMETVFESLQKLPFTVKDEGERAEKFGEAMKEFVGPILKQLNGDIESSGGVYLFGDNVSALDIVMQAMTESLAKNFKFVISDYPHLEKCVKAVAQRPKIAKWLKERPVTEN